MEKKKFKFKFPSAIGILLIIMLLVSILTYVVPGGAFGSHIDPATGEEVVGLEDFYYTDSTPVSPLTIPVQIVSAFSSSSIASIVITYLFMGGAIHIITESGTFQAFLGTVVKKLNGNRFVIVFGFTFVFAMINLVLSPHALVAFVPLSIELSLSLGYDVMVGVAMPLLGGAVAFSTGPLLATTMMAQSLVGLPPFSGAGLRFVCLFVLLIPTILYIYRYAEKVRKQNESAVSASGTTASKNMEDTPIVPKHVITLILFICTMALIIYGSSKLGWSNTQLAACFMVLGIVVGLLFGNSFEKVCAMYITGSASMLSAALLAALAGAATNILNAGGIMFTVVHGASKLIMSAPKFLYAPMMFWMHLLINCVIVSGGGQATATMPIMKSIANICGIPMQSAVLCYNFGDGLGNYVLPHSNQLITYIGAGNVSYKDWMKFMGKLFIIWVLCASVLVELSTFVWG